MTQTVDTERCVGPSMQFSVTAVGILYLYILNIIIYLVYVIIRSVIEHNWHAVGGTVTRSRTARVPTNRAAFHYRPKTLAKLPQYAKY